MSGTLLLTLRDLQFRKTRLAVVTAATGVVFALLFLMNGVVEQFNREPYDAVSAFGAESWVLPPGVSGPFTSSATMTASAAASVDDADASPVVVARGTLQVGGGDTEAVVVGVVPGGLGEPSVDSGRSLESSGDIIVDASTDLALGDTVGIGSNSFTVVGTTEGTTVLAGLPLVFIEQPVAQQIIFGSDAVVSAVLTGPSPGVEAPLVVKTGDEVAEDALGPLENAIASVDLIRLLLWLVAAIIIGAVVYLSALERTRDFAVLKAVGAGNRSLMAGMAVQAVAIALVSVALAMVLQAVIRPLFPLTVRVTADDFWQIPLVAVLVALAAAAAGVRRVRRADPAAAFGGPGA